MRCLTSSTKLTPNLVVSDLQRSVDFYRDVLGFAVAMAVPDEPPHVFAALRSGLVDIFLNARESAVSEYPPFRDRPLGATLTLFIDVQGIHAVYDALRSRVRIVMPLEQKWHGVTEFAFEDPDGYIITFAEHSI